MDVFALRDRLKSEHEEYFESFVQVADDRIQAEVQTALTAGLLWPYPRVGLNPAFEPGGTVGELVEAGRLDSLAGDIFRVRKSEQDPTGKPLTLHRHQTEAIDAAAAGRSYVLTTGTGSGKSLAYIMPIVDHVLRTGSGNGVKALVLYPMNALANSQYEELAKFLNYGPPDSDGSPWQQPVSFGLFTGQQDDTERDRLRQSPPDILLTNYVMAEYILTRHIDSHLVKAMSQLRFLVLDELHSYRGRQGADVAMLVRRIREACAASLIQCVGTSATLSTEGTTAERDAEVAAVASKLFGTQVRAEDVISETLRRVTTNPADIADFDTQLKQSVTAAAQGSHPADFESFRADAMSVWMESAFGIATDDNGPLRRAEPISIEGPDGAAVRLGEETGLAASLCETAIRGRLLAGGSAAVRDPDTGSAVFAFRLHQFFSSSGAAYATLENPAERSITMRAQRFVPGDRQRAYLPLAFCRWCGQEYYIVHRATSDDGGDPNEQLTGRDLSDTDTSVAAPGFVFLDPTAGSDDPQPSTEGQGDGPGAWPVDYEGIVGRLPDDWRDADGRLRRSLRDAVPAPIGVTSNGTVLPADAAAEDGAVVGFWLPTPFRFCMGCEVSHADPRGSDFSRLAPLDAQGRSTATTITSITAVRHLRSRAELPPEARKLLSFTDNRQDASLQSGHLNDFVAVALLRAGLYKALGDAGELGLRHDNLASEVANALNLPSEAYAINPAAEGPAARDISDALEDVVAYRLYLDLRRGWRINLPNLEQCGMLRIGYRGLNELADDTSKWNHPLLAAADVNTRRHILKTLLDTARRRLAINVNVLERDTWRQMQSRSEQHLRDPWSITGERHQHATELASGPHSLRWCVALTPRSGFGRFLNRPTVLGGTAHLRLEDRGAVIDNLVEALRSYDLMRPVEVDPRRHGRHVDEAIRLWRLPAAAIEWRLGDGTPYQDPILMPAAPRSGMQPNPYFERLYKTTAADLSASETRFANAGSPAAPVEAREHTAQVSHEQRQRRERRFRRGELPVLYCSPTMELGVDIAELNVVHMRNVPPTPANYAQRSGRAGRGGQPALVTTFCSSGNPHDQYFFTKQQLMVSGQVQAPRLDLANEELVRAHVHAVWLAETGVYLGNRMREVLDLSDETSLPVTEQIDSALKDDSIRRRAHRRAQRLLDAASGELDAADWYSDQWLTATMGSLSNRFDSALDRWRRLYQSALRQAKEQNQIMMSHASTKPQRDQAEQLHEEAIQQLGLLRGDSGSSYNSDFYPYRYFASEGFLPGYSFPRLPLSAYVPRRGNRGDLLQRPRFLAVSEFGPNSIIYHEGSQYLVKRIQLSAGDLNAGSDGPSITTSSAKRCEACGYMHPITNGGGPDVCELCSAPLPPATRNLYRMGDVSTARRNRITSDEEQRQRQGYDITSAIEFADRAGTTPPTTRTLRPDRSDDSNEPSRWLLRLTYGDAAQIWRINNGPRRAGDDDNLPGFLVDPSTGRWRRETTPDTNGDDDDDNPDIGSPQERVVPYVSDTRNVLLIEPATPANAAEADPDDEGTIETGPTAEEMASLQAALAKALQAVFQLEPTEIAVEPLPSRNDRRLLLVYESDEGGAGVLKQLVTDATAWQRVAAEALNVCHAGLLDPASLNGPKPCEGACYDCLMSYTNQLDHGILDRDLVIKFLAPFAQGAEFERDAVDAELTLGAESGLEQQFLQFLQHNGYRRPDRGQQFFKDAMTRPDFVYDAACAVVYVDGPHHDFPERSRRDVEKAAAMANLGFQVIRFTLHTDWRQVASAHPAVFGSGHHADTAENS